MKNPVKIQLNNVSFQLKENHDFSWLEEYGEVFAVFDKQDSGNIAFGVRCNDANLFIKYAGASTLNYNGKPEDAIQKLRNAMSVYEDLQHENLVKLIKHYETQKGYVAIFEWFSGESLYHGSYLANEKHNQNQSSFYRFQQLPIDLQLSALNTIFSFHVEVEKKGYVAVDFYDGSIMYDFDTHTTMLCDIDYYQKRRFINHMGKLWGSSRFMSPEEFQLGAEIDSKTNVFNMGALAFVLLGGGLDRSFDKWKASTELYNVALKAVDSNRNNRYDSVSEFFNVWKSVQ